MAYFSKRIAVKLGDLGEGTKEATIKQWFVQPGAQVQEVIILIQMTSYETLLCSPRTYAK